jgi:phosphoglycolate phosphatase
MRYKAIIFDMDGTLLNTLNDIGEAVNRALAANDLPQHRLSEYRFFVGEGAKQLIEYALPADTKDEGLVLSCLNDFFEEYDKTWNQQTQLYPGIDRMLDNLETLPIRKSILSNKPDHFTKACAREYLKKWKFEAVMGCSDTVPRKPDPAGALMISSELDIRPAEMLFVGDTKIDMQTARNSGMTPVGVLWGFRPKEELVANGAVHLLNDPHDLFDLISR